MILCISLGLMFIDLLLFLSCPCGLFRIRTNFWNYEYFQTV